MKILGKKPAKIGNSYGFLIPMAYITNKQISVEEEYDVIIKKKKVEA